MLNLTLRHMRSLSAIARSKRIAAAAADLGLTPPAVTLQLKQMEEETGVPLFDRTADGMRLTAAGQLLLRSIGRIQDELRVIEEGLTALKGGRLGTLRLGAVSTAKYFTPKLIAGFREENPGIRIELFVGNRAETISALSNHDIDIAIMGRPPRGLDVVARVFGDHPLVVIAPPDHRLAARHDVSKEELLDEHFLLREPGSGTRGSLEIFFADLPGTLDNLGTEMGSNETIKQAVMAGLGIAFISGHTIEQEIQLGKLVILDVRGMPIRRLWFSIRQRDKTVTPAMELFSDFLGRRANSYLPVIPNIYPEAEAL